MYFNRQYSGGECEMRYELHGYNIDNLLKTLYRKKIVLMNVERVGTNCVSFEVRDNQTKKVQKYISNFKTSQTPNFFKRLPQILLANLGVVIAIFVGVAFYLFSSNYIWQIRIYGLKNLTQDEILSVLEQNGVKTGKLNVKSAEEIEQILLDNYDRLAQVSVIKQGSSVVINLSEKLVYIEQEFLPITAKYCGVITDIDIVTGTTNVKVGDYVNQGDILVFPYNTDSDGNKINVKPMAKIEAKIYIFGSCTLKEQETVLSRTGKYQICYDYYIFGRHIFYGKNKNSFALFENVSYNENVSKILPFKRTATCYYELGFVTVTHDLEQEKQIQLEQSRQQAEQKLPNDYVLIDTVSRAEIIDDTLFAYTKLTIKGQIND